MDEIIAAKLAQIEQREGVRVLFAAESGSRAWGFASPDSDYDVRFIYVRPRDFYLRIDQARDVIEWELDETFDINGWDVRKALRLLYNANPRLFEWDGSPIVYRSTNEWASISVGMKDYFSARTGFAHYLNTAEEKYEKIQKGKTARLKTYFYVIRPLLACKWILDQKSPPPMPFGQLVEDVLEASMKPIVEALIHLKMDTPETGEIDRPDALNTYIEKNLVVLSEALDDLPETQTPGWGKLNELFLSVVG